MHLTISDIIKKRKSIRTYDGQPLTASHKEILSRYLADTTNLTGPFGTHMRIELSSKIGTYGMIKDPAGYLVAICPQTKESLVDCGYVLERLVLLLEAQGIGSCWLGGTFNRKKLAANFSINESEEVIPAIISFGYPATKPSFKDNMVRKTAKSHTRKDFNELFFYQNFHNKIMSLTDRKKLESIRLAPSAYNRQPWRIVLTSDQLLHFFVFREETKQKKAEIDLYYLDIGIGISHYVSVTGNKNYVFDTPDIKLIDSQTEYILTIKGE